MNRALFLEGHDDKPVNQKAGRFLSVGEQNRWTECDGKIRLLLAVYIGRKEKCFCRLRKGVRYTYTFPARRQADERGCSRESVDFY